MSSSAAVTAERTVNPGALREMLDEHQRQTRLHSAAMYEPDSSSVASPAEVSRSGKAPVDTKVPEADAMLWAVKNIWFGKDAEMTQRAYQVGHPYVGALHACSRSVA